MDDQRVGRILRALRHRLGWRQSDVAREAGLTQDDVSRAERGRSKDVRKLRRHGQALDADVSIAVRWRGGEIDRLLDEGHAAIVGWVVILLEGLGWEVHPEVSFAVYGERGSIDVLAWHAPTRTLLVVEVKTELASIEETLRVHDVKQRLAAAVGAERFGWQQASAVCRMLVLPGTSTPRRQVRRHDAVLAPAYRRRGDDARSWLAAPSGSPSLLVFVPHTHVPRSRHAGVSKRRIRRADPKRGPASTPAERVSDTPAVRS